MAQVFVANTTPQIYEFTYQLPETRKQVTERIPMGGQIRLSANRGDFTTQDIDSIVVQHEPYGLVREDEIGRRPGVCPLILAVGRSVRHEKIVQQIQLNRAERAVQGDTARRAAAVATNQNIEDNLVQQGRPEVLREVSMEFEEDRSSQPFVRSAGDEDLARQMAESTSVRQGIRVSASAPVPAPPRRRRKRA